MGKARVDLFTNLEREDRMSLGVVIKGPEGIVLAADSRITLDVARAGQPPVTVNFDNATKLLSFSEPNNFVGAVTYGAAVIGLRTAQSFIPEFEQQVLSQKKRRSVLDTATEMSIFFAERWKATPPAKPSPQMTFIVGGYDEGASYGKVFLFSIPNEPTPVEQSPGDNSFGVTWGGQLQVASRLIQGFDPLVPEVIKAALKLSPEQTAELAEKLKAEVQYMIPFQVLALQDCVNLAIFLIRTTIDAQGLAVALRGAGGMIEVATITRTSGLKFVQQKKIQGEC